MLNSFVFLFLLVFGLSTAVLPFLGITNFYIVAGVLNFMISAATLATIFTYWTSQRTGDFSGSDQRPSSILYTTVTFMALATGLCLHCSRAVVQGLFGKSTPFVRTPKLNITAEATQLKGKQAYTMRGLPPVAIAESALAIGFIVLVLLGIGHPASVFTGVYLFYAIGFIVVAYLSLREKLAGS
jgi:hypothetical protein